MDLADVDYDLPPERIAQNPIEPRDSARLLVDLGPDRQPSHRTVADLPELVRAGDLLVVNDTRVLPARLRLRKPTGGEVEVLLLEPSQDGWEALVRPSRKVRPGTVLTPVDASDGASTVSDDGTGTGAAPLRVEVGEDLGEGRRRVRLLTAHDEMAAIDTWGQIPLPPYIHTDLADPERYQTVYAARPASVAAPTAGLHLTPEVLDRCLEAGAEVARVELVVGMGTFRPITSETIEDHVMHAESYSVPAETLAACEQADRVVAIGTTSVRALESAAATGRLEGRTDLFIHGDHPWRVVDLLLTNFHVPRSSLLVMIESFVGPRWRDLYQVALAENYRFLSFGDAMLLERR